MKHAVVSGLAVMALVFSPALASAQSVSVARSVLPTTPYTLIFPEPMVAASQSIDPVSVTINHPGAPLQCDMTIVPVDDTEWTAEGALNSVDDAEVAAAWSDIMPGFALGAKTTAEYQDATALLYEGSSPESNMGVPLTVVHTETVVSGRGYTLDCYYATAEAANARPLVDFIIANFATRSDADCCIGAEVAPVEETPPAQ
ncbi:hypothetical protein SAMN06295905_1448 [Devosia lucknowensis]|uniref:Uncharacterized protein n=1 Tax=Devosia lucknowensis TaxID=1096929 RepID=A0A1Y6EZ27_9HYPH|nr:hypothetical protein [Devosia lucknowensis]SMQ66310.1 hypothetical protein SAMN06295905_1448 [Devosia lucknowensis]